MSERVATREVTDVVVVGARVAGAPAAIELAQRGARVIAMDAATFPSDTLSTHVLVPTGVAELKALGVLDRLLATGTPTIPYMIMNHGGYDAHWTFSPVDGIDYSLCPRRTVLDHTLVERAREVGAEVREATKVTALVWDRGRVAGVCWKDREGNTGEIACKLVIGADGRRSTIAELVGAKEPYKRDENGRGLVFMYVKDHAAPGSRERQHFYQWRVGDTLGMYFPTCDNEGLALFMGPKEQVADYGQDLKTWNRMLAANPNLAERVGELVPSTKLRKAADTFSYFRRSSGPGWALVGDAGHFKDPVIAQGVRDALYYGRRLGMAAAPTLDDPAWLDHQLFAWELQRDRDCMSAYYFGLRLTKTHHVSPIELELFKEMSVDGNLARDMADTFSRVRTWERWMTWPRLTQLTLRAFRQAGNSKRRVLEEVRDEVNFATRLQRDLAQLRKGRRMDGSTFDDWNGLAPGPRASGRTRGNPNPAASRVATGAGRPAEPQTSEIEDHPAAPEKELNPA